MSDFDNNVAEVTGLMHGLHEGAFYHYGVKVDETVFNEMNTRMTPEERAGIHEFSTPQTCNTSGSYGSDIHVFKNGMHEGKFYHYGQEVSLQTYNAIHHPQAPATGFTPPAYWTPVKTGHRI